MSWTGDFIDRIGKRDLPTRFLLESVACGDFYPFEGTLKLSSFEAGPDHRHCIMREDSSIDYGQMTPGSWTRTFGELQLGLALSKGEALPIMGQTARGQVVILRVGFADWSIEQFETVFIGVVRSLTWSRGRWVLRVIELLGGLTSRFASDGSKAQLFSGLESAVPVTVNYTAADANIDVGTTAGFEQSTAGGGEGYLIYVTPTSGSAFYLRCTIASGTRFAITARNLYGTTDANALAGSTVAEVAHSISHPLNMARRILTSTGTSGSNGTRDVLAERWGYGIPIGLVDEADIEAAVNALSSSALTWDLVERSAQNDGLTWLQAWLRPGGFFLGMHQGRITARAILDPEADATPDEVSVVDDEIEEIESYSAWDEDVPVEYYEWRNQWGDGSQTALVYTGITTRPVRNRLNDCPNVWSSASSWDTDIRSRLHVYETRIPERVTLTCAGFRQAMASMGDVVTLTSAYLTSRFWDVDHGFTGRRCLLLGGGPDWFAGRTRLVLCAVAPFDES